MSFRLGFRKLSPAVQLEIKALAPTMSVAKLAEKFSCAPSTVRRTLNDYQQTGRTTKDRRRLSDDQVRWVRTLPTSRAKMAAQLGVSQSAIGHIVHFRSYKEIR